MAVFCLRPLEVSWSWFLMLEYMTMYKIIIGRGKDWLVDNEGLYERSTECESL